LWDRWRRTRRPGRTAAIPRQVLLLAFIAILTHPILDTLNTYGVRWLMPFSEQWFYGDTLFIADPWAWLFLGAGTWLSRRRERQGGREPWSPARRGIALFAVYVAVMIAGSVTAHGLVEGAYRRLAGRSPVRVLAAPVAVTPFRRSLVIEEPDTYRVGTFHWLPYPHVEGGRDFSVPDDELLEEPFMSAAATPEGAAFLRWARFPTLLATGPESDQSVYIIDLRYATEPGAPFGTIRIPAPGDRDILVRRPREDGRRHAHPSRKRNDG
ncbi:MAG: metal-dependent hydrolase, partial [Gemmatimonadales bacterium]